MVLLMLMNIRWIWMDGKARERERESFLCGPQRENIKNIIHFCGYIFL